MIYLSDEDLVLKPKITLYNNLASNGNCYGRLLSELEIFPLPRIIWDFETLGENACRPEMDCGVLVNPFIGSNFLIEKPIFTNEEWGSLSLHPRHAVRGTTPKAIFGNISHHFSTFRFFLPNARFQEENLTGQKSIETIARVDEDGKSKDISHSSGGRSLKVSLDNDWVIRISTSQIGNEWLDQKKRNLGTQITTTGQLFSLKNEESDRSTLSMEGAVEKLSLVSRMLSFANGGYIGPIYIEGFSKDISPCASGIVLAYKTTPLEQVGPSWLTAESDLIAYLQCFSIFERMIKKDYWKENFDTLLSRYFQAIQPDNTQVGKPVNVIANVLGTTLEILDLIIMEYELGNGEGRFLRRRVRRLLDRIGLTEKRGYIEDEHIIKFKNIRNDATHANQISHLPHEEVVEVIERSIQWVDEIILWRLGYNGKYRDKTREYYASTEPRFDLTSRDPNW